MQGFLTDGFKKYQWMSEAELHTKLRRTILYSSKDVNNNTIRRLTTNDIVIAPYNAVLASFKEEGGGLLHQIEWHRVSHFYSPMKKEKAFANFMLLQDRSGRGGE